MLRARTAFAVIAILVLGAHGVDAQQQPPQASFRSRITIVPLDVRVLDRHGKPVTDLKQEDFTIVEDDAPQTIRYFATQSLSTDAPGPGGQPELRKAATAEDLTPQNRRVFLILFGRGRMQGPSKELPALLAFLQKRLLPQDQVALLAFNRGTDFTTNHEAVRAVVERYRDRHERIETLLEEYFYDLRAQYGSKDIPAFIQTEINGIFGGATGLRPRELAPGQASRCRGWTITRCSPQQPATGGSRSTSFTSAALSDLPNPGFFNQVTGLKCLHCHLRPPCSGSPSPCRTCG